MGKYLSVIGGLVAVILGIWWIAAWWYDFTIVFRGLFPPFLILGGLIALSAGLSELKDEAARKKEESKKPEEKKPE
jgi:hypothetical protein